MKAKFVIRNNPGLVAYILYSNDWRYFMRKSFHDRKNARITIRKNSVFVHLNSAYSVLVNDIGHMIQSPRYSVEMSRKSLEWIKTHYDMIINDGENNVIYGKK